MWCSSWAHALDETWTQSTPLSIRTGRALSTMRSGRAVHHQENTRAVSNWSGAGCAARISSAMGLG